MKQNNLTMAIDLYEFTQGKVFFDQNMTDWKGYFDIFYRKNPFQGGYALMGGLEDIIRYIQNFHLTDENIEYLRTQYQFSEPYLNYLRELRFHGDVYAIPDGTSIFPMEPVLTVRANIIEAILLETALLCYFNHGTLVTTKAKRITSVAQVPVMEFGTRRGRGLASATELFRYAYIGGCVGTSNTLAAQTEGKKAMGTMAHLLVQAYDTEYDAFLAYAKSNPNNTVFLVDTYDTLHSGIPNAIKVAKDYLLPNGYHFDGIRIDSGDLAYLSKEARKLLDEAGFYDTKICLSNGLDEYKIESLKQEGAVFDSLGVGDNISASLERVGGVYKLAALEYNGQIFPKIKVSEDSFKTTNPGYKKVYRFYDKKTGYALGDVIALYNEEIPLTGYTLISEKEPWKRKFINNYEVKELQVPIIKDGICVYQMPTLDQRRDYCESEMRTLYPEVKRLKDPHQYYVDLSLELLKLKKYLVLKHQGVTEEEKGKYLTYL